MLKKIGFIVIAVLVWEGCKHAIESNVLIAEKETAVVMIETFTKGSSNTVENWVGKNCKTVPNFAHDKSNNEFVVSCFGK